MLQILVILFTLFHPFYISVTEIKHNERNKSLEISSKVFYDDLEAVLEKDYKMRIDILNPPDRKKVDAVIADYFSKHLQITVNQKKVNLQYLGYQIEEEAAWCYFEVPKVVNANKLLIINNILFKEHPEQINMLHVIVKGKRESTKLDNPQSEAQFTY